MLRIKTSSKRRLLSPEVQSEELNLESGSWLETRPRPVSCAYPAPDTGASVEVLRYSSFRSERHVRPLAFLCHPERSEGSRASSADRSSTNIGLCKALLTGRGRR